MSDLEEEDKMDLEELEEDQEAVEILKNSTTTQ